MFPQIKRADTQVCPYIFFFSPLLSKERDRVRFKKENG